VKNEGCALLQCLKSQMKRPSQSGNQGDLGSPTSLNTQSRDDLSKFDDDSKQCDAVDMLEGRDDIQTDLGRLERWACVNLVKFNTACTWAGQSQAQIQAGWRMDGEQD